MKGFREKVENEWGGGEPKGEASLQVEMVTPLETQEPLRLGANRNVAKGLLYIPFKDGTMTACLGNVTNDVLYGGIF